jgi:hypothetical protein
VLAFLQYRNDAGDKIVNEAEAPGFLSGPLNLEFQRTGRLLPGCGMET